MIFDLILFSCLSLSVYCVFKCHESTYKGVEEGTSSFLPDFKPELGTRTIVRIDLRLSVYSISAVTYRYYNYSILREWLYARGKGETGLIIRALSWHRPLTSSRMKRSLRAFLFIFLSLTASLFSIEKERESPLVAHLFKQSGSPCGFLSFPPPSLSLHIPCPFQSNIHSSIHHHISPVSLYGSYTMSFVLFSFFSRGLVENGCCSNGTECKATRDSNRQPIMAASFTLSRSQSSFPFSFFPSWFILLSQSTHTSVIPCLSVCTRQSSHSFNFTVALAILTYLTRSIDTPFLP